MRTDTQGESIKRIGSDTMDEKSCVELLESVNSIVLRWNAEFIITYVNDYGERFFGYRGGELVGRSVIGTIVPETSDEGVDMGDMMRDIFRHPESYANNENENLRKDGSRVWVSWTNRAVIGCEGRVAEIVSIGNDITPLKKARDALKHQLVRTQMLIDAIPVPVFYKDASGTYKGCNKAFEQFMDRPKAEIVGKTVFDMLPRALAEEYHRADEELRNRPATYCYESVMQYDRRPEREIIITKAPLYNEDGSLGGLIGTYQDITDRKRIEEELLKTRGELEARVLERTRELQASNELLRNEIDQHRKAEEALRDSERKFRAIFDQTFEFIGLMSLDGILLAANQTALKFSGIREADVIGKPFWETPWWTHSRDLQDMVRSAIRQAAGGALVRFEVTHRDAKGNLRYGDFSIKPVRDEAGRVILLIPESRDTTEAKLAEKALRESEASLHSIFRAAPTGIGLVVNRVITRANDRLCEMTGYPREKLVGGSARMLYPTQEDYDYVGREKYRQISASGTGTVETRWRHKDGHILNILLSSTPLDPENLSAGVTFTALDITERKRSEEALLRLTRQDEEALQVAHMGHWEYDIATGMFVFNDLYYRLHGMTAKEAGGYQMSAEEFARKYVDPEYAHTVEESIEAALKTTDPNYAFQTDSRILRADGEPRDVTVWFRVEKDSAGRTVRLYGVSQDITERKRAERALEHAKAQAELYVDLMSHDISNMHQALLGYLELAELAIPMEPRQRELIEKPIEIVNHSARLIDNVRKLERAQKGLYGEKVVDMCALVNSVAEEFSGVDGTRVTINRTVPDACQVIADDILRDVFSNIVENAVRHSSGPVVIDIAVEPVEIGGRKCFRASIADSGPGIPDEQKRRVFSFMQGYQAKPGRRGLGLCLVKTLVEQFDGRVWVENRVPEDYRLGAKFIVELPAA